MESPMTFHEDYKQNLEAGRYFQDCASSYLDDIGIRVVIWTSARVQRERGESKYGYEFKYDMKWRDTGNLAIETAERASTDYDFSPAGPYHFHQPEWIVIGDCCRFWLLGCAKLCSAIEAGGFRSVVNKTKTARISLVPTVVADELAAAIYEPNTKEF
jgi:hypothetical protein